MKNVAGNTPVLESFGCIGVLPHVDAYSERRWWLDAHIPLRASTDGYSARRADKSSDLHIGDGCYAGAGPDRDGVARESLRDRYGKVNAVTGASAGIARIDAELLWKLQGGGS